MERLRAIARSSWSCVHDNDDEDDDEWNKMALWEF